MWDFQVSLPSFQVTDPDFPDGPPLPVVSEPLWQTGDKALLMQACRASGLHGVQAISVLIPQTVWTHLGVLTVVKGSLEELPC